MFNSSLCAKALKQQTTFDLPLVSLISCAKKGVKKSLLNYIKKLNQKVVVLNNPTISIEKPNNKKDSELLQWFTKDQSIEHLVLAAGRLTYQKDFSTLIKAFNICKVNAKLLILGNGDEKDILKNFKKVIFENEFGDLLLTTFYYTFFGTVGSIVFGILTAQMVNQKFLAKNLKEK